MIGALGHEIPEGEVSMKPKPVRIKDSGENVRFVYVRNCQLGH